MDHHTLIIIGKYTYLPVLLSYHGKIWKVPPGILPKTRLPIVTMNDYRHVLFCFIDIFFVHSQAIIALVDLHNVATGPYSRGDYVIIISPIFENFGGIMFLVPPPSPPPPHANACTGHNFVTNTPIKFIFAIAAEVPDYKNLMIFGINRKN